MMIWIDPTQMTINQLLKKANPLSAAALLDLFKCCYVCYRQHFEVLPSSLCSSELTSLSLSEDWFSCDIGNIISASW